jgi:hypothetical protein
VAQDVKEGVMGMGQSAKESVTGRPTVSVHMLKASLRQMGEGGGQHCMTTCAYSRACNRAARTT